MQEASRGLGAGFSGRSPTAFSIPSAHVQQGSGTRARAAAAVQAVHAVQASHRGRSICGNRVVRFLWETERVCVGLHAGSSHLQLVLL